MISLNYKDSHPRARRGLSFMMDKPFVEDNKQTQCSVVKGNETSACIDNPVTQNVVNLESYSEGRNQCWSPNIKIILKNKYI